MLQGDGGRAWSVLDDTWLQKIHVMCILDSQKSLPSPSYLIPLWESTLDFSSATW